MLTRTAVLLSALAMPAAAGFMTGSDAVQEQVEASMAVDTPGAQTDIVPDDRLYFTTVDVDAMMRAPVIDPQDRVVGSVAELMVSGTGQITDAVVRLTGGPLGLSGERIVVGFDRLTVKDTGAPGDETYVLHAAQEKAALENLPRFEG
ncbi:hypothetical protein P1J78_08865 [Psychromarinibacter sp. C21-152]|uniref:PRC-barrel domain-containing protein n=1 Tax=Psychromarinibacter sediminicola TaxID=3033385 RepID=A0AAE3NTW1_9RHOB|nr:hypothetical protein [Psychromarinibacter sediminicola]MDF0600840.1 hypothetical protein [Psychromarinibacter sediminicola]